MAKWAIGFGVLLTALGLVGYFGSDPTAMTALPTAAESESDRQEGDRQAAERAPVDGADKAAAIKKSPSKTALIPSVFGLLLLLCGTLGLDERMRKHALHAAAGVGLIGFLAAGYRVSLKLGEILAGNISRPTGFIVIMTILCLAYVLLSVYSFTQARRARKSSSG